MKLLLIIWFTNVTFTAYAAEVAAVNASLIVDGTTAIVNLYNPPVYEKVDVKNHGRLIINGVYLKASTLKVDETSFIGIGHPEGGYVIESAPPDKTGTGGTNAGRGGGPLGVNPESLPSYATDNFLRRVDQPLMGGYGANGVDVHFVCPIYPRNEIDLPGGNGGDPGGALQIFVDHAEILGTISVNGKDGKAYEDWRGDICYTCGDVNYCDTSGGGGGSGGTLQILAKELIVGPSATLTANGGAGGQPKNELFEKELGYAGGGGRVQIYYEAGSISPKARIEARAGFEPHSPLQVYGYWAGDGTVYIKQLVNIKNIFEPSADVNNDGMVDKTDLMALVNQWGNAEPTLSPTLTPTRPETPTLVPTETRRPTRTREATVTPTVTPTPDLTVTPTPGS